MEGQKIFFSYSRVDGEKFALGLASDLRKTGVNVWIDQLDIRPGKPWDTEIEHALETSTCVLFVATPHSTSSNNVLNEVYYALDENKEVIPVIFGDCRIPFRLKRLQHINFTADYDTGFNRLLEALKQEKQADVIQQPPLRDEGETNNNSRSGEESQEDKSASSHFRIEETFAEPTKGKSKMTMKAVGIAAGLLLVLLIAYLLIGSKKSENKVETGLLNSDSVSKGNDTGFINSTAGENKAQQGNSGTGKQDAAGTPLNIPPQKTDPNNPPVVTSSPITDTNYYRLQVKSGLQYLDADHCSTAVAMNTGSVYADGACQKWRLVPARDGWNGLQLKSSGYYLRAENCGNTVVLIPASDFDGNDGCQLWRLIARENGWSVLQLQYGKFYLAFDNSSNKIALTHGLDSDDGAGQLWRFERQ